MQSYWGGLHVIHTETPIFWFQVASDHGASSSSCSPEWSTQLEFSTHPSGKWNMFSRNPIRLIQLFLVSIISPFYHKPTQSLLSSSSFHPCGKLLCMTDGPVPFNFLALMQSQWSPKVRDHTFPWVSAHWHSSNTGKLDRISHLGLLLRNWICFLKDLNSYIKKKHVEQPNA